jgi:hypothetical protein
MAAERTGELFNEPYGAHMLAKNASKVGPRYPQVVVLVGATGDLSRRKLLPGLFHLVSSGFIPGCRIIGVSLEEFDTHGLCKIAREALDQFSSHKVSEADWAAFSETLDYVPMSAGPSALKAAVDAAEVSLGGESRRVHYLSVPPAAALPAVRLLAEAGLHRGADLSDRPLPGQGSGAKHPGVSLRQRPVRADLEPELHRPCADRCTRDAGPRHAFQFL